MNFNQIEDLSVFLCTFYEESTKVAARKEGVARLRNHLFTNCLSLTAKGVKERVVLIFIFCSQPCADSPSFAAVANLPPLYVCAN